MFVHVIARGRSTHRRDVARGWVEHRDFDSPIRRTAGSGGGSDSVGELARLPQIRAPGDITDQEYARAKNLVLSGTRYSG